MQHMYGNIPHMFDCWVDPVLHLLLLKSAMVRVVLLSPGPTTPIKYFRLEYLTTTFLMKNRCQGVPHQ